MATPPPPSLPVEIGPDGLVRENPVIAYTERKIEAEQLQLKRYIQENYSKIREVERELENLNLELKLTAGPKKAALEHLRKKVELSTERIRMAKLKEDQAKKVWEAAAQVVKDEEAMKQKLCDDLNQLAQESTTTQITRLEELKRRIESLNPSRVSSDVSGVGVEGGLCFCAKEASPDSPSPLGMSDAKSMQQSNITATQPAIHQASEQAPQAHENANNPRSNSDEVESNSQHQPAVAREKKTLNSGIMPKGRGSRGPGWTGAGFDVDGRT